MFKVLFFGAVIGIAYALLKTQRKILEEHAESREANSRWEGEGGAPTPSHEMTGATA